jgi:hypothetical protein
MAESEAVGPTEGRELVQIQVGELQLGDVGARVLVPYESTVLDAKLTRMRGYLSAFKPNIVAALEFQGSANVKVELDPVALDFLIQIEREASHG